MAELALAAGIEPIICSVTPCDRYKWRPEVTDSADQIVRLNMMLKAYSLGKGLTYVDYHSAMKDSKNALREGLSKDGCHPELDAYQSIMEPILMKVLKAKGLVSCE